MRIGIDCRALTSPRREERTFQENLLRALAELARTGEDDYFLYTREPSTLTDLPGGRCHPVVLRGGPEWAWIPWTLPGDLFRKRVRVAHFQRFLPPVSPCPAVVTVPDAAHLHYPDRFSLARRRLLSAWIPTTVRYAARVITGSEAAKRDLVEQCGAPPAQVDVIHGAPDPVFRPLDPEQARRAVRDRLGVRGPYLLAGGLGDPLADLPGIVRAYHWGARSFPHGLLLLGRSDDAPPALWEVFRDSPRGREPRFTGPLATGDLPALYAGAELFLYPHRWDGGGMPVLEAMASGTVTLAADAGAIPEVGGEAVETIVPGDETAWAAALERLLGDDDLRRRRREAGLREVGRYSWEKTARMTLRSYAAAALTGAGISQPFDPA